MELKKSKEASLENKKLTYLLFGFVFVLSACFVALEWTEKQVKVYDAPNEEFLFEEELDIQQTSQETPPPPPPAPVQEIEVLNVVENDVQTERIEIVAEDNNAACAVENVIFFEAHASRIAAQASDCEDC